MTITGGTALSKDDIDRMVSDAEKFAAEDHRRREAAEARNQADQLVYQVDQSLQEWGDKVAADQRADLEKARDELKEALGGEDPDRIRSASDALMQRFQTVGQAMYASAQAAPNQGGTGPDGGGGAQEGTASPSEDEADDVVEGEIVDEGGAS
jgi:molecular chaperone DnaK